MCDVTILQGSTTAASVDSQAAAISKLASAMAGTHIAQGSMAAEGEEAGGINKAAAGEKGLSRGPSLHVTV